MIVDIRAYYQDRYRNFNDEEVLIEETIEAGKNGVPISSFMVGIGIEPNSWALEEKKFPLPSMNKKLIALGMLFSSMFPLRVEMEIPDRYAGQLATIRIRRYGILPFQVDVALPTDPKDRMTVSAILIKDDMVS
jgi:hypothetical protein